MKYGFNTKLVDFDGERVWVAESTDLKGCIGQGDSVDDAIAELSENEKYWLEIAERRGITVPQPSVVTEQVEYSGKMTLRLGSRLHRETAECARKDGLSINQHIINAVVSYNSLSSASKVAAQMIREAEVMHDSPIEKSFKFSVNPFDPSVAIQFNSRS